MSLSYYFVLLPFSYNLWINYNKRGIPLENCQNLLETNRLRVNENLFHFKEIIESFHFCALCIPILKTTRRTHTHHGEIWLTDLQRSPFFHHEKRTFGSTVVGFRLEKLSLLKDSRKTLIKCNRKGFSPKLWIDLMNNFYYKNRISQLHQ